MKCHEIEDRIDAHLDGLLTARESEKVRAHAEACEACSGDLRRARLFRDLLAGEGGARIRSEATRRTAAGARRIAAADVPADAPAATRRFGALPRLAAAAAVLAAVAGAWALGRAGDRAVSELGAGEIVLARGEQRLLAEGRTVVADESARLARTDESGETVRLSAGAAVFEVRHGLPFAVETPQGVARVLGTCFHVAVRPDRGVAVTVMNGSVRFEPKGQQPRQTLRAGTMLEVDGQGAQRLVSRVAAADLENRVASLTREVDTLRAALDEAVAAGESAQDAPRAPSDPASVSPDQWRDLGGRIRLLLQVKDMEKDPRALQAMSFLFAHPEEMTRLTGSTRPWDWPMHPAVLARTADGFVAALAPDAEQIARDACVEEIRTAATAFERTDGAKPLPTEAVMMRLRFFDALLRATRDRVGDAAAAEIGRFLLSGRDGVHVRAFPYRESTKGDLVGMWTRSLKLDAEAAARIEPLVSEYVDRLLAAQDAVTARLGVEEAKLVMGQRDRGFRPRRNGDGEPTDGNAPAAPATSADGNRREMPRMPDPTEGMTPSQIVDAALARTTALIELAAPRVALEQGLGNVLGADAVKRALWFGSGITTYRR